MKIYNGMCKIQLICTKMSKFRPQSIKKKLWNIYLHQFFGEKCGVRVKLLFKGPFQPIFDFSPLAIIPGFLQQMLLLKFDCVYTLVDLRPHF